MSRLGELLGELRADGVTYAPVGEVATYVRGVTYRKSDEEVGGPTRILRANNITLSSNTLNFEEVKEVSALVRVRSDQRLQGGDILISAASGSKKHVGKAAYVSDDIDYCFGGFMAVLRVKEDLDSRFLFHVLTARAFSDYLAGALAATTINNLNAKTMCAFRTPVPPLAVQQEIARVLDEFTELESGIDHELNAEINGRRRQYDHLREVLLTFDDDPEVPRHPMSEVGTFTRGKRFTKADVVPDGIASIHYGEIYTGYGVSADQPLSRVRPDMAPSLRFAKRGDVIIAGVGETVEDVAKAVAWLGDEDVAFHDDCWAFRSAMNPKFVAYYLQTRRFQADKRKHVARAKVKRISADGLGRIQIPLPARESQDRIVSFLDTFDALISELAAELRAELKARRTQFEHCRDELLTFEEAVA